MHSRSTCVTQLLLEFVSLISEQAEDDEFDKLLISKGMCSVGVCLCS